MSRFAVIIPNFNQGWAIARAIESAISQSYEGPITVLIMDGGSSDGTLSILENAAWRDPGRVWESRHQERAGEAIRRGKPERVVCWWSSSDIGPQDGIRKGIRHLPLDAIVGVQCSSDEYAPEVFDRVAEYWTVRPDIAYLAGQATVVDGASRVVRSTGTGPITWRVLRRFPRKGVWRVGWLQSAFFRADLLHAIVDEWPPVQSCHSSWLFHYLCRALREGFTGRVIPEVWATFYRHGDNFAGITGYWEDRAKTWHNVRPRYPELTPWWSRLQNA